MDVIAFGGAAIGTIISISEFMKGSINFAGAFIIIMLSSEFFIPLRLLGSFFHIAMNGMAASDKIFKILDMETPEMGIETLETELKSIEFKDVNFSYEEDRLIINKNSFKISKGDIVSFVGESGSGKSTIASLIMGINKGYTGNILIGEKELSNVTEMSIMKNITLIDNNSYLFKGTVRENLTMGNMNITDKEMNKVLKKVNLYDFLNNKNGLDTILLEKGSNLSGGQHQRLALARAILRDTSIYIFDEATSNIDMESEDQIMDIIYELSKEKTIVLISHRVADGVIISTISMMSSFGPVLALSSLSSNLRHTLASGDRVVDLLEEKPVVEEKLDGKTVSFEGAIFNNVSFSYGSEKILDNYSIDIEKNNIIGIHGRSGSGKFTLLKLLIRFWDVDSGDITISGEKIKEIKTDSLRDIESYVTQETYLFNDTIANNIGIGKEKATLDDIKLAAKKASIDKFIRTLPDGYDTNVGELGDSLSSGEKQRIGIVRAFLHDAPFMLLDEPTSNLDSLNEGIILKALKEESKDKTMILVSHRKSTMNIADIVHNVESERLS